MGGVVSGTDSESRVGLGAGRASLRVASARGGVYARAADGSRRFSRNLSN